MEKPTIYINVGMIGSGKSTYAKQRAQMGSTFIVSARELRNMLIPSIKFQNDVENLLTKISDNIIKNCASEIILGCEQFNSIIIDNFNLTKKERRGYINLIKNVEKDYNVESFFNIVYLYFIDMDGNGLSRRLQDNLGFEEEYWENVWTWQIRRIEPPTISEVKELNVQLITINL